MSLLRLALVVASATAASSLRRFVAAGPCAAAAACLREAAGVQGRVLARPSRVQERMREQEKVQEEVQKGQEHVQEVVRVQIQVLHLVRRQYDPRLWLVVVRVERAGTKLLQ